ncbi:hypothetical protein JHK82_012677 [Glycine max]|nr:hypothetical protein JHK85_013032 [Glycine max]KAG5057701.1 hypothetical protein JHK86_012697 [Glycine max]KAG5154708.1 hypothetical protein JHK82_012677 [Glycine max]
MATKSKTYQDTIDIADTTRGAKSALVPMAARKATSADTVDTKQENLPDHSEEGGFATRAQPGWLCKTPRGGSRTMAVQRVALQGGSGAMAMTRGLYEHHTNKVEDIIVMERDEWKRVDYQLVMMFGRKLNILLDIKCANILVDVSGQVKLAGFGLAKSGSNSDSVNLHWPLPLNFTPAPKHFATTSHCASRGASLRASHCGSCRCLRCPSSSSAGQMLSSLCHCFPSSPSLRVAGFPVLGIEWQKMENPNLQMEIGMKPDQKGVHNRRIDPTALESKVLNPSDVIPSFDGLILPMME